MSDEYKFSDATRIHLKDHYKDTLNNNEFALFEEACGRYELDPMQKQIYARKDGENLHILCQIDGLRAIADRTGAYAGSDDAVFSNSEKLFKNQDLEDKPDVMATVTVYKFVQGVRVAFTASARWSEYYPGPSGLWESKSHIMLAKCAEAMALRKGFPTQLGGLYATEEMEQGWRRGNKDDKPAVQDSAGIREVPVMDQEGEVDLDLGNPVTEISDDQSESPDIDIIEGAKCSFANELRDWAKIEVDQLVEEAKYVAWAVGVDMDTTMTDLDFTKMLIEVREQVNSGADWSLPPDGGFREFAQSKMGEKA